MNYLRKFIVFSILIVMSVGALNWFIDPYAFFWSPRVEGLNTKKIKAGNRSRLAKPFRLGILKPEVLLIGNSRIEMGIPSESSLFDGYSVYNAGIPGLSYKDQWEIATTQIESNPNLTKVILSLDYMDFLTHVSLFEIETKPLEVNNTTSYLEMIKAVLSLDTFTNSFLTVLGQTSQTNHITEYGTNVPESYIPTIRAEGKSALFKQKLQQLKGGFFRKDITATESVYTPPYIYHLLQLISLANSRNVELLFFISPYHISYIKMIEQSGRLQDFCQWKEQVLINAKDAGLKTWDFSLIQPYTTEFVDMENNNKEMEWFWEPAHYKAELGNILLSIMIDESVGAGRASMGACSQVSDKLQEYDAQWENLKSELGLSI